MKIMIGLLLFVVAVGVIIIGGWIKEAIEMEEGDE